MDKDYEQYLLSRIADLENQLKQIRLRNAQTQEELDAIWNSFLLPWTKEMSLKNVIEVVKEATNYVCSGDKKRVY